MSDKIDDGRQFHSYTIFTREQLHTGARGISRRDWLAGLAMQGLLSNPSIEDLAATEIASDAYIHADAMITKSKK